MAEPVTAEQVIEIVTTAHVTTCALLRRFVAEELAEGLQADPGTRSDMLRRALAADALPQEWHGLWNQLMEASGWDLGS